MPVWLQIVIGIVGLLGTILGILGVSAYINERAKHRATRVNLEEDERERQLKELENQRKLANIREVFKEEVAPIKKELKEIRNQLEDNTKATVTELRCDMKDHRDRYLDRGFATVSEKAAFNDLYDDYKGLGGNHFKNYVDGWKHDVDVLPNEKQKRKTSKTPKKLVLVENKK